MIKKGFYFRIERGKSRKQKKGLLLGQQRRKYGNMAFG